MSTETVPPLSVVEPFMTFQRLRFLRGPNIWSRRPCLEVWVDLGALKDFSSEMIPGFNQRYKDWLPSVIEHRCSVGERGGFFQRLDRGTYLAHILEHTTLELQTLAGCDVGFGRAREMSQEGVYKVAIRYEDEALATDCLLAARELLKACIYDLPYDVELEVARLRSVAQPTRLPPATKSWLSAAAERYLPLRRKADETAWIIGHGHRQREVNLAVDSSEAIEPSLPAAAEVRIPIITVIGTRHAAATVRLIKDKLIDQQQSVGWSDGVGVHLNQQTLDPEMRCSTAQLRMLLTHPDCTAAVVALSPDSILESGLPFDRGDVAIVTDVDWEAHLGGAYDLFNRDKVLAVFRSPVDVILPGGTAILNASDAMAVEMKPLSQAGVILFARDAQEPALNEHRQQGQPIVTLDDQHHVVGIQEPSCTELGMADGTTDITAQLAAAAAIHFLRGNVKF